MNAGAQLTSPLSLLFSLGLTPWAAPPTFSVSLSFRRASVETPYGMLPAVSPFSSKSSLVDSED